MVVVGDAWNEADLECRKALVDNQVAYIPPFDHPYLWYIAFHRKNKILIGNIFKGRKRDIDRRISSTAAYKT